MPNKTFDVAGVDAGTSSAGIAGKVDVIWRAAYGTRLVTQGGIRAWDQDSRQQITLPSGTTIKVLYAIAGMIRGSVQLTDKFCDVSIFFSEFDKLSVAEIASQRVKRWRFW